MLPPLSQTLCSATRHQLVLHKQFKHTGTVHLWDTDVFPAVSADALAPQDGGKSAGTLMIKTRQYFFLTFLRLLMIMKTFSLINRNDSLWWTRSREIWYVAFSGLVLGLRQASWETLLQSKAVSHWQGRNLESALPLMLMMTCCVTVLIHAQINMGEMQDKIK